MIDYVIYNSIGQILQSGTSIEKMLDMQADSAAGEMLLIGKGRPDQHYVVNGEIMERPSLSATASALTVRADGAEEVLVTGIPVGAELVVIGPMKLRGTADGEPLPLTFALPGAYTLVASAFPNKDWMVTINAI